MSTCDCSCYEDGKSEILKHPVTGKVFCVDKCIAVVINYLLIHGENTQGCCCGHNKFAPSIVFGDQLTTGDIKRIRKLILDVDDRRFDLSAWYLCTTDENDKMERGFR